MANKIENHIRAIFGGIDVPSDNLLLCLFEHTFEYIYLNSIESLSTPLKENVEQAWTADREAMQKALFPANIKDTVKLGFHSYAISFYIATSPLEDLNKTQVEIRNNLAKIRDRILDPKQDLRTTIFDLKQLLHYCRIIDKDDGTLTFKRDLIKELLYFSGNEHSGLTQLDKLPGKQSITKLFVLEPVKFDIPITIQRELLRNVTEHNRTTASYKLARGKDLTDVFAPKTVAFEAQIFRTKLDEFTDKLIIEYEKQNNKGIFDDFDGLYSFVEKQVALSIPKDFAQMKSGTFNHELSRLNKRTSEDDFKVKVYRNAKFTMRVSTEVGGKFLPTTQRLLNVLLSENTVQGDSPEFTFTISNYMQLCGLKDRKETIKQVVRDAKILFNSWFEWKEVGSSGQMRVIEKWDKTNDTVKIRMAPSFWEIYKKYPVGLISKKSLGISIRTNPNSQHFSFKITQHKNMNYGKPTENIIAVKTLLEGSEIPSYEEVMENDKHTSQRITEPFERDMDALKEDFTWEYCGKNGTPLTDEEASNLTYDVFIKCNVKISWKNFPDQTRRLEKKIQYIEEAKKRRTIGLSKK